MRYQCTLKNTQMKTHLQKENEDLILNSEMLKVAKFRHTPRESFEKNNGIELKFILQESRVFPSWRGRCPTWRSLEQGEA